MDTAGATRVAALILCLTALALPCPAIAAPADLPEAAPGVLRPGRPPAHAQHAAPPTGTDQHLGPRRAREARAERDVALAATWHLDPALLAPAPTDSGSTAAARQQLALINGRLRHVLAAYDRARAAADTAALEARAARDALAAARQAARAAAARYRADRELMMAVVTEAYSTSQLGALSLLLSADSDEDLVQGITVLQELGRSQSDAVRAAEQSRDRLREASAAVAVADRDARETLAVSRAALDDADDARARVLADVRTARSLLEHSVLADQALREEKAGGYDGALSFPLPAGTGFVDQHNWGRRSRHWASVHTGDDFSTPCGTPVLAVNDGTVVIRTDQGWSGPWLVMVSTGAGGLTTWYAHMQSLLVSSGQPVVAGQQIGVVGRGGNATGCHLHLEVHPDGGSIYQDDTDPSLWLRTVGAYPA
jgi:murein DD-endopeptidase MepM/ murein hydrolase activator NlpD